MILSFFMCVARESPEHRDVWKGIFGIRDLAKIRCGIRVDSKNLNGKWDLTVTWEAVFTEIWA